MVVPVPVNVATALIGEVVPIAVLGNEKTAGSTTNCEIAGGGATPNDAPELVPDDGVAAGAAGDTG